MSAPQSQGEGVPVAHLLRGSQGTGRADDQGDRQRQPGERDFAEALGLVERALASIRASEQRAAELEQQLQEAARVLEQREAQRRSADTRLRELEERARAAETRADAAEHRAREVEGWLSKLHDAIKASFSPRA